ncbi:hypothetical protein CEXT_43831 [Caerostris extrusa]|uniref:Uncharacterized protein n=1 Tax=Caerostris extrusa TaxID=172846 RepID=A0AAV4XZ38_CAEEX|nr:hypothetical protein CEXT_43831 [Caerostris extrusa]
MKISHLGFYSKIPMILQPAAKTLFNEDANSKDQLSWFLTNWNKDSLIVASYGMFVWGVIQKLKFSRNEQPRKSRFEMIQDVPSARL